MSSTAVVPTWLVVLLSLGTPALTFVAALLANAVSRKGAVELERRSRREESMRHLKWAAEAAMAAIVRDTTSKVEDAEERGEGVVVVLRPPQEGSTPHPPQTDHPGTP